MRRLAGVCGVLALAACTPQPATTTVTAATTTTTPTTTRPAAADPTEGVGEAMWRATSTTQRASRGRRVATTTRLVTPRAPQGDVERAICDAFGAQCAKAVAVARCESGLNPAATNGNHRGVMQISIYWHYTKPERDGKVSRIRRLGYTPDDMWQVGPNLAVALDIYRESGWAPWTCA